ncbi:Rho GTPase activation protein [Hesseltinella vesiculosa]|uniref:Rho GTPase activation protein n=1 Tax=Hesseltinella vesiculosa TaxID=101127 RepID=A0A1X2G6M4_9FUNG|nr:Rho GTPase activation protein [Hesseltinella vesiculosa]
MVSTPYFPDKRFKNPLYYLWTKWSVSTAAPRYSPSDRTEFTPEYTSDRVPRPVQLCIDEILKRGLTTEGLFRLSGATAEVKQLQKELEVYNQLLAQNTMGYSHQPSLGFTLEEDVDLSAFDIHSIASFVKKYLFHLPVAVIPPAFHEDCLQAAYLPKEEALAQLVSIINARLPLRHRHLLHAILSLAGHIQHHAHRNKMNPEALAVVLVPVCTGLETTMQVLPTKKPGRRLKKKINSLPLNPIDLQRLVRTNAQWTMLWKWMIEEHQRMLHTIHLPRSVSPAHLPHDPVSVSPFHPLHHPKSLPSLRASPLPSSTLPSFKQDPYTDISTPNSAKPFLSVESPRKLRPKSSCQSFLSTTASLCAPRHHGLLRKLASVSSFR